MGQALRSLYLTGCEKSSINRFVIEMSSQQAVMCRFFLIILCFFGGLQAQEVDPAVVELRETISKIVDVQAMASSEKLEWEVRKQEIANLLELHGRELVLLDEELEGAGQSAPGHLEATEAMREEIEALKATRRLVVEAVARNAPRTLGLAGRLPAPLLADCETELATLRLWKPADEPREALQAILSILSKSQQFNRRFTRGFEVRDGREVEVLYLGLAAAYYADRSKNAGTGRPGADGWKWQSKPELNREVLNAFDMLDKKRPPAMVRLPLQLQP